MATCLVLQHAAPERPYAIAEALTRADVELNLRRTFDGEGPPPNLRGIDAVVVMGGPMAATSDAGFPTRRAEVDLLAEALEAGIPVLGVCLGAQLLAVAAGANVYSGPEGDEIGWARVALTGSARTDPLFEDVDDELTVLHWHGDTFDLPPGAVLLASSERYCNQAFRVGAAAWGLQFHIEVDEAAVVAFLASFGAEAAFHGSDPSQIARETPHAVERLRRNQRLLLDHFAALLAGPALV